MPSLVSSESTIHRRLIVRFVALRIISLTVLVGAGLAQTAEPVDTRSQQSGTSTGVAHAPIKDAQSRPITAGGFVDGAPVIFSDITRAAGLDKFHHKSGTPDKSTILETPGSGVTVLCYLQPRGIFAKQSSGSNPKVPEKTEPTQLCRSFSVRNTPA